MCDEEFLTGGQGAAARTGLPLVDGDGMLAGPNFDLLEEAALRLPHLAIQASGGVSSLDDLQRLRTAGAIVGKALWEGRVDLSEAVSLASV